MFAANRTGVLSREVKAGNFVYVKTRKEATVMESTSAMKARVGELEGLVEGHRERKDEYAAIISQRFQGLSHCMLNQWNWKQHCHCCKCMARTSIVLGLWPCSQNHFLGLFRWFSAAIRNISICIY